MSSLRCNAATHFVEVVDSLLLSVQANCIDSTAAAEAVFASEVEKLKKEKIKPQEQITLEPYERDHAVVTGIYRCAVKIFMCVLYF